MSKRNKLIGWWATLAAAVVLCTALPADAQERGQGPGRGFRGGFGFASKAGLLRSGQVQTELELNDEQKQKVSEILDETVAKMREVQGGFSPEAREERAKLAAEADEKVASVLNEDQAERLDGIAIQVIGPQLLDADRRVAKKLKLSDEQQQKISGLVTDQREKIREFFTGGPRDGLREKMQELQQETNDQILAVLSAEQKKQWEAMKGEPFELERRGPGGGRPRGNN